MIIFPAFRGVLKSLSSSGSFSPQSLSGLIVWLDPSDSSTVLDTTSGTGNTPINGGNVARIKNKASGYLAYQYIQNTTTMRPTRQVGASDTGLDCLRFSSANSKLLTYGATDIGRKVSGMTIFASAKQLATPSGSMGMFFARDSGTTGLNRALFDFGRSSTKFGVLARRIDGSSSSNLQSATQPGTASWNCMATKIDHANNSAYLYINSTTADNSNAAFFASGGNTSDTQSYETGLGGGTASEGFDLGEICVFNRLLNSTEMTQMMDYFTTKW